MFFTDCESCMRPISTNLGSREAGEYGLTLGTSFVARRLEVVAVAGLLWIPRCVLGAAGFRFFPPFFFFERTRPAVSMKPSCLIYLSTGSVKLKTQNPFRCIYNRLEIVRVQRVLIAVVAAAACCYCCNCGNESASPKTERRVNKKKRGGRSYKKEGWMGRICKDRWGINMKNKRSSHFRPEWYMYHSASWLADIGVFASTN